MRTVFWLTKHGSLSFRAVAIVVIGGWACKGMPQIRLDITLPRDLVDTTTWFEVAAFKGASCAALKPMLADGVPDGSTARVAFRRDDSSTPKFGTIPNASYAFAAVARDENCAVLAIGCSEVDVDSTSSVSVAMSATETPTGKCTKGASCQAAKCVPANDNSDPSVGAGCSLELLGAGPLPSPVGGGGSTLSAPAIGATKTGFVVVYREVDANGAGAHITILPIDPTGGALKPLRPNLPNPCSNADESDGVGLVVNGDAAMIALAKAPCGAKAELQLLNFVTTPDAPEPIGHFFVSVAPDDQRVSLGPARAAATRASGSLVVYTQGGKGLIANMDPVRGIVEPTGTFGAVSGITSTWMTATDTVLGLLSVGEASAPAPPPGDAGAEGGAPVVDAGGSESTVRLVMADVKAELTSFNVKTFKPLDPISFPGQWGSIAAIHGRVIVMSNGSGPGRSVTYRAYDYPKTNASDTNGFTLDGDGAVTAGDVAIVGDRAYFASLKPGAVALHVFANATTTLTPLRSVVFRHEPRVSAINIVRDGRVAVVATETRVAVTWTTAKVLGPNDATGGYAVFGCTL